MRATEAKRKLKTIHADDSHRSQEEVKDCTRYERHADDCTRYTEAKEEVKDCTR